MALEPDRIGLVLGGGGITGIAWELGMLHGLATHGLDLSNADVVVGTSAGSVVGTLISSVSLDDALATQFEPPDPAIGAEFGRLTMLKLAPLVLMPGSNLRKRRRIGSAALRAHPAGGRSASTSSPSGSRPPTGPTETCGSPPSMRSPAGSRSSPAAATSTWCTRSQPPVRSR